MYAALPEHEEKTRPTLRRRHCTAAKLHAAQRPYFAERFADRLCGWCLAEEVRVPRLSRWTNETFRKRLERHQGHVLRPADPR